MAILYQHIQFNHKQIICLRDDIEIRDDDLDVVGAVNCRQRAGSADLGKIGMKIAAHRVDL